jgi:hypothetical protein
MCNKNHIKPIDKLTPIFEGALYDEFSNILQFSSLAIGVLFREKIEGPFVLSAEAMVHGVPFRSAKSLERSDKEQNCAPIDQVFHVGDIVSIRVEAHEKDHPSESKVINVKVPTTASPTYQLEALEANRSRNRLKAMAGHGVLSHIKPIDINPTFGPPGSDPFTQLTLSVTFEDAVVEPFAMISSSTGADISPFDFFPFGTQGNTVDSDTLTGTYISGDVLTINVQAFNFDITHLPGRFAKKVTVP